jgi:hypothetical protein
MEYKLLTPEKQQEIINELILEAEETHFRNNLWKQMEEGTLWRNSRTALSLLYSIDVGLDSSHTPGHQDWDALKSSLEIASLFLERTALVSRTSSE